MGTMNFSVPDEVKEAFNRTFGNENKSAIVARLMRQAIEERERQERRRRVIDELLRLRDEARPASDDEIGAARQAGRP